LGLSPRRVINWVGRGFITPAKEGKGPGISRKYSFENLVEMKIIKELSNFQMLLPSIKVVLRFLFEKGYPEPGKSSNWKIFKKQLENAHEKRMFAENPDVKRYLVVIYNRERNTMSIGLHSKNKYVKMIISNAFKGTSYLCIDLFNITNEVEKGIKENL
jgi:hypothetical protein